MASQPLRILVAIDFSPESLAALKAVRSLLRRVAGNVTIAHVRPTNDVRAAVLEERGDLFRVAPGSLARGMTAHYEERLGKTARPGETVRLLRGEAARELCRESRKGYDLLAMGSRGRGGAAAFLLGSTVQEALTRSPIPLVVVPSR